MRPGLRGDWAAALTAFDSNGTSTNSVSLHMRAGPTRYRRRSPQPACDRLPGTEFESSRMPWRLTFPPDLETLELLLRAEERAGSADPYKWMASQLHVIAASSVGQGAPSAGSMSR